jgi:hypothetical protein
MKKLQIALPGDMRGVVSVLEKKYGLNEKEFPGKLIHPGSSY